MKTFTNRVPYKEFLSIVPHPAIIESLTNKYPVVIEKVEGIAKKRHTLGKIIPKLQHVQMKEYGYHTGLLKNENLVHTHVNPLVDQVTAPSKHDEERYPETYRKHSWPQVEGYQEAVRDIFGVIQQCAHVMAGHLDGHVIKTLKPDASKYQSLVQMTKESQMTTARSFYYRERKASEDSNKPSFNFHYDRMNMSACIKDFFYLNGQEIEQPDGAGLIFNTKNKERYQLRLKEDEVGFHIGMTYHILSAGIIPAHAHAVYLPNTEGLSRASQAFFFSPSPHIDITPPVQFDNIASSLPEDEGVVPKHIGLTNWQPGMKYTDWNEAIVRGFKKVFFNE